MIHIYDQTNIFYKIYGNGENLVVFLHGWGAGSDLMQPLAETFKQNNETSLLLIDFPPFGKSEEPKKNNIGKQKIYIKLIILFLI